MIKYVGKPVLTRGDYDGLVEEAIDEATENIGEGRPSPVRVAHALRVLVQRMETHTRAYTLLSLRTVEDVAAEFGVTTRRIRAAAANRHERFGIGTKLGRSWIFTAEEVEMLRPYYRVSGRGMGGMPRPSLTGETAQLTGVS